MKKKGFEFSFGWMFAIIVGAVIIFLAIYATTRLVNTERNIQDTEIGKELGIILNPIETNLESGKKAKIVMSVETRLYNNCFERGNFGRQELSIATKSGIGETWKDPGEASSFINKYIFSSGRIQGNKYRVFAKPFEFPFKVADLIFIWSENENYCFVNAPREIKEEIENLQLEGINLSESVGNCQTGRKIVCFNSGGCDIDVSLTGSRTLRGSVKKKFSDLVYFDNLGLLYGAIFSDSEIYECQVKRLMKKSSELALLYYSKSLFLTSKGCASGLETELVNFANKTYSVSNSLNLRDLSTLSETMGRKNNDLLCKLF
jgi:hypothetical protein